ncbi:hypothetical protein [Lederbergia citrea]|uniref:hypothetical protein n=1 Tax=Lederbergia citrea TaxID=2833581 RepID=UPI001BCA1401|nr:hypothetical protein [Lederbergia citrea]MBS4205346.1 hypothetical protein [Lederbergia citrea]
MSTVFSQIEGASKLQIKAFVKGDSSPFHSLDFSTSKVYELTDYTLRTPLEKMDVFNELLQLEHNCELWILPVREETTSLLREIPKDEIYDKTASLFAMLSTIKETVERDRTFMIAKGEICSELVETLQELGFTLREKDAEELLEIELL